jgi:hypothetical protein
MSFGVPVRNGVGVGLLASTSLSTRRGTGGSPIPANAIFDRANDVILDRATQIIEVR